MRNHLLFRHWTEVRRINVKALSYQRLSHVLGHKLLIELWSNGEFYIVGQYRILILLERPLTVKREVEEDRHIFGATIGMARVRESSVRIAKLVEEWMHHSLNC